MNSELVDFFEKNKKNFKINVKPASTPREILRESGAPYLPIDEIKIPYTEMLKEALSLEKAAIPHRSYSEAHKGWKSVVLHGLSSIHTQGAEQYGFNPEDDSLYTWTDIARFAPVSAEFFKTAFHYDTYQRVRFMYLEPGGYILPHTDMDHYVIGPTNIALNNPEGCEFIMENIGVVPFIPGRAIKLALCNRHAVWNKSNETRVHMIVHGSPNYDFWAPIYIKAYAALYERLQDSVNNEN